MYRSPRYRLVARRFIQGTGALLLAITVCFAMSSRAEEAPGASPEIAELEDSLEQILERLRQELSDTTSEMERVDTPPEEPPTEVPEETPGATTVEPVALEPPPPEEPPVLPDPPAEPPPPTPAGPARVEPAPADVVPPEPPSEAPAEVSIREPVEHTAPEPADVQPGLRLRNGQTLNVVVTVAGEKEFEDLNRRVSDTGHVSLALVGRIHVANRTLDEVSEILTKEYQRYIRQPRVAVEFVYDDTNDGRISSSPWGSVSVLGRVKNPGRVNIPPTQDLTLSMALQRAGGFDSSAKEKSIRVTRKNPDGSTDKFKVNLRTVASKGQGDVRLQDGDVVFVPERFF